MFSLAFKAFDNSGEFLADLTQLYSDDNHVLLLILKSVKLGFLRHFVFLGSGI